MTSRPLQLPSPTNLLFFFWVGNLSVDRVLNKKPYLGRYNLDSYCVIALSYLLTHAKNKLVRFKMRFHNMLLLGLT